jgi:hypothetical protein
VDVLSFSLKLQNLPRFDSMSSFVLNETPLIEKWSEVDTCVGVSKTWYEAVYVVFSNSQKRIWNTLMCRLLSGPTTSFIENRIVLNV